MLLGRPRSINLDDCDFRMPLDCPFPNDPSKTLPAFQSDPADTAPSAFSLSVLRYKLCLVCHEMKRLKADKKSPCNHQAIQNLEGQIHSCMEQAPASLRLLDCDASRDHSIPQLSKLREMVASSTNQVIMVLHRPHISTRAASRDAVFSAAMEALESQSRLFALTPSWHYRQFGLSFDTIDAAILLSAIAVKYPPQEASSRQRALGALKDAVHRLKLMQEANVLAKTGLAVLRHCSARVESAIGDSFIENDALAVQRHGNLPLDQNVESNATSYSESGAHIVLAIRNSCLTIVSDSADLQEVPFSEWLGESDWNQLYPNFADATYWLDQINQITDPSQDVFANGLVS